VSAFVCCPGIFYDRTQGKLAVLLVSLGGEAEASMAGVVGDAFHGTTTSSDEVGTTSKDEDCLHHRGGASSRFSPWIRKPLHVIRQQEAVVVESRHNNHQAPVEDEHSSHRGRGLRGGGRHLTLFDLLSVGVGGTVGSGIFVLTGQIARNDAGPWTFLSFAVAGAAACCSGVCYAELAGRIPAAGSTYAYSYATWGELVAVVSAACLTLEYGVAGAAVARSWGDKVLLFLKEEEDLYTDAAEGVASKSSSSSSSSTTGVFNLPAGLLSLTCTVLLLKGVQESKTVTNFFTVLKLLLVAFMTIGGFVLWNGSANMRPMFPPPLHGASGIWRGATSSFFGYLGYDEVCCIAGEAVDPARNLPRAVIGTLAIVAAVYVTAALALTGMQHYQDISATSAFPQAFEANDWRWAAQITAFGELVTLPVVVLISLMAQPRLLSSMGHDGLLPARVFSSHDSGGNLLGGIVVSGAAMTIVSAFVKFTYLDDLISAGILVAFCITNSSLVLLRCESPQQHPKYLERGLILYNLSCFFAALLWSHKAWFGSWLVLYRLLTTLAIIAMAAAFVDLVMKCPKSTHFGGSIWKSTDDRCWDASSSDTDSDDAGDDGTNVDDQESFAYFSTPCVPYLPCAGMAINWYLIAQLDVWGIVLLFLYVGITVATYMGACARHSVGHHNKWTGPRHRRNNFDTLAPAAPDDEEEEEDWNTLQLLPLGNSNQESPNDRRQLLVAPVVTSS